LQLLREVAPAVTRVVFLHSDNRPSLIQLPALQASAATIGIQLLSTRVRSAAEIEHALDPYAGEKNVGLVVAPSALLAVHRKRIVALAAQHRFPAVYYNRRYAVDGGLMSYGVDRVEQYRRAASYVDRILKGAKPADLPVQMQEKFEFVLNLKTAKTLGLDVPRFVLARADEIIE
jgi:putative ABC transport system substrate-binding protein